MTDNEIPRTTGRVHGKDPNVGGQAAKASSLSQDSVGCCATRRTKGPYCFKYYFPNKKYVVAPRCGATFKIPKKSYFWCFDSTNKTI